MAYLNINGQAGTSPWIHEDTTHTLPHISNYEYRIEVPKVYTYSGGVYTEVTDFWDANNGYQGTISGSTIFGVSQIIDPESATVVLYDPAYPNAVYEITRHGTSTGKFTINLASPLTTGLYVKYRCDVDSRFSSDSTSAFLEDAFALPVRNMPNMYVAAVSYIAQIRRVITNMERYLEMTPTVWVGGINNTDVAVGCDNIIPGYTPVSINHINALINATNRIYQVFANKGYIDPAKRLSGISSDNWPLYSYIHTKGVNGKMGLQDIMYILNVMEENLK